MSTLASSTLCGSSDNSKLFCRSTVRRSFTRRSCVCKNDWKLNCFLFRAIKCINGRGSEYVVHTAHGRYKRTVAQCLCECVLDMHGPTWHCDVYRLFRVASLLFSILNSLQFCVCRPILCPAETVIRMWCRLRCTLNVGCDRGDNRRERCLSEIEWTWNGGGGRIETECRRISN